MNQITAPYGFVPLSKTVHVPDWVQPHDGVVPPLHDVPFEDGLCGTLELEIQSETPIFTRGTGDKERPFQLPDGCYAIPGTAVRGALRNVVEIATFGRFCRVNDHRYAVRDLQNRNLYGKYMAEIVENLKTGKKEPMPLVNAGWLTGETDADGEWSDCKITVCDFAKIEYRALGSVAQQRGVRNFQPGNKQSSVDKYRLWGQASLDITVQVEWMRPDKAGTRPLVSGFGRASLSADGSKGKIVFTGQPSFWKPDQMGKRFGAGNAKHHDFVFLSQSKQNVLEVDNKIFEDFEFGHSDRGQQNALGRSQEPNPEWKFWKQRLKNGEPVPVFFLTGDSGNVSALGLAMMFRLPYQNSVGQAIDRVSEAHRGLHTAVTNGSLRIFDFAEGLFGTVRESARDTRAGRRGRGKALALKGRIGVSHARATGGEQPNEAVQVILGAPKASYYPNYVEQDPSRPGGQPASSAAYKTWNDTDGAPRGWKRYRVLTETWKPKPPRGGDGRPLDLSKVGTRFHPLPSGTTFRAHVDIHNLLPQELGALLWVIDFGQDDKARHMLGMARPLGYGRVRMSVGESDIRDMAGNKVDLLGYSALFVEYMEKHVPNWSKSAQIEELRALARPVAPSAAYYQRLDPGQPPNEFAEAKKQGLALPSAFAHASLAGVGARPANPANPAPRGRQDGGNRPQGGGRHGDWQGGRQGGPPQKKEGPPVPAPKAETGPYNPRNAPAPLVGGQPWRGKKRDEIIEVELTDINRKGKWRCTVVGYTGTQGTLGGLAPADAASGRRCKAVVIVGNDPLNLELQWPAE